MFSVDLEKTYSICLTSQELEEGFFSSFSRNIHPFVG